jgi:hypothetical protein
MIAAGRAGGEEGREKRTERGDTEMGRILVSLRVSPSAASCLSAAA